MFLTDRQIRRLTGLQKKSEQIKELERLHIRHWVNAAGKPVVPCSAIDSPWKSTEIGSVWTPDLSKV